MSKPNAHEFGELEMRQWWKEKDYLDFENEFLIRNDTSQEDLINMILTTPRESDYLLVLFRYFIRPRYPYYLGLLSINFPNLRPIQRFKAKTKVE